MKEAYDILIKQGRTWYIDDFDLYISKAAPEQDEDGYYLDYAEELVADSLYIFDHNDQIYCLYI